MRIATIVIVCLTITVISILISPVFTSNRISAGENIWNKLQTGCSAVRSICWPYRPIFPTSPSSMREPEMALSSNR